MTIRRRSFLICISVAMLVALVGLLVYFSTPAVPAPRSLPRPNGYDLFVRAGQLLTNLPDSSAAYATLTPAQQAGLVATNAESLRLVRAGLSNDCVISLELNADYIALHMSHILSFKRVAFALLTEGRLAESAGHTNDAARIYLTIMQFGQKSSREGVMMDRLVGVAIETIGLNALQNLTNQLSASECHELARALEKFDTQSETSEDVLKYEDLWAHRAYSLPVRIKEEFSRLVNGHTREIKANFTKKMLRHQLKVRQLTLAFATRAYELEKGRRPQTAADLTPDYLRSIPENPETKAKLPF